MFVKDSETLLDIGVLFPNFTGKQTQYNREGDRNFLAVLSPEQAQHLIDKGWSIRVREPKYEGQDPQYVLPVKVNFTNGRPPKITQRTSRGSVYLDEDTVDSLDYAEIVRCDIIVNPYNWEAAGKTGCKAYLGQAVITLFESELDLMYG